MAALIASFIEIPGGTDAMALVACVTLTAAVLIFIFLVEPDPGDAAPRRTRLDQLLERRDTIYDNLRDLKFEYRSGKFAEQDYEQMRQTLENEAALVLTEIETVTGNQARLPRRDASVRGAAAATPAASKSQG